MNNRLSNIFYTNHFAFTKIFQTLPRRLIFYDKMKLLAIHLTPFTSYASAQGVNVNQVLEKRGLSRVFDKPDNFITIEDFHHILNTIKSSLKNKKLGIRAGTFCKLSSLGVVHHISLVCITMREALYYLKDFIDKTLPIMTLDIKQANDSTQIELNLENRNASVKEMLLECYLTIIAREIQLMSIQPFTIEIYLPSDNLTPYSNRYILEFPIIELKSTLKNYQEFHFDYLIPHYLNLINSIKDEKKLESRVKSTLLQMATPELPSLKEVADIFCTTPRTLQRALSDEGVTFREILNEVKKQISSLLLKHEPYLIKDISHILGYSETAAFVRAFYSWYGLTPSKYIQTEIS